MSNTNSMFEDSFELLEALTPKRVQLIRQIHTASPVSIRDLAEMVERDIKNVWDDLQKLSEIDLIDFHIHGRVKRPVIKKQIIVTTVRVNYYE